MLYKFTLIGPCTRLAPLGVFRLAPLRSRWAKSEAQMNGNSHSGCSNPIERYSARGYECPTTSAKQRDYDGRRSHRSWPYYSHGEVTGGIPWYRRAHSGLTHQGETKMEALPYMSLICKTRLAHCMSAHRSLICARRSQQ